MRQLGTFHCSFAVTKVFAFVGIACLHFSSKAMDTGERVVAGHDELRKTNDQGGSMGLDMPFDGFRDLYVFRIHYTVHPARRRNLRFNLMFSWLIFNQRSSMPFAACALCCLLLGDVCLWLSSAVGDGTAAPGQQLGPVATWLCGRSPGINPSSISQSMWTSWRNVYNHIKRVIKNNIQHL